VRLSVSYTLLWNPSSLPWNVVEESITLDPDRGYGEREIHLVIIKIYIVSM
jgi:hypothetical protein